MSPWGRIWQLIVHPGDMGWFDRVEWLIVLLVIVVYAGLFVGQHALGDQWAFYPRDRFTLALSWSLLVVAFLATLMIATAWWFGGVLTLVMIAGHLVAVVGALIGAFLLMPSKPKRRQPELQ